MLFSRCLVILTVALASLEKSHAFTVSQPKGSYHGAKSLRAVPIDLGGMDTTTAAGILAAVAVGGIALATKGASSEDEESTATPKAAPAAKEPEPPKPDLSIPYDSAARLAYDQWRSANGQGDFNEASYAAFRTKYEALTVANVVAKKIEREMAAMAVKKE